MQLGKILIKSLLSLPLVFDFLALHSTVFAKDLVLIQIVLIFRDYIGLGTTFWGFEFYWFISMQV